LDISVDAAYGGGDIETRKSTTGLYKNHEEWST